MKHNCSKKMKLNFSQLSTMSAYEQKIHIAMILWFLNPILCLTSET